jgi:hypothetical protein
VSFKIILFVNRVLFYRKTTAGIFGNIEAASIIKQWFDIRVRIQENQKYTAFLTLDSGEVKETTQGPFLTVNLVVSEKLQVRGKTQLKKKEAYV